jgi:hypothetical protein
MISLFTTNKRLGLYCQLTLLFGEYSSQSSLVKELPFFQSQMGESKPLRTPDMFSEAAAPAKQPN